MINNGVSWTPFTIETTERRNVSSGNEMQKSRMAADGSPPGAAVLRIERAGGQTGSTASVFVADSRLDQRTQGRNSRVTTRRNDKFSWRGEVVAVQPRIRLMRSFDESAHSYLGYVLRIRGELAGTSGEFVIALGKAAYQKHGLRIGDRVEGRGLPVADRRLETAELYKVSALKIIARGPEPSDDAPPFLGVLPTLDVYRARGRRRLAARTYARKCSACMWGCEMAVEMTIDPWNPSHRYRRETFCYGPKNCAFYKAGPTRKVPGRKGMSWEEEDWIDEEATGHRGPDE